MEIVAILWALKRDYLTKTVKLTGRTENCSSIAERILIQDAFKHVESAQEYRGIPLPGDSKMFTPEKGNLVLNVEIVFPSITEMDSYCELYL